MTIKELVDAGFTRIISWDEPMYGRELWARKPARPGTVLQDRKWAEREASDIIAIKQAEAERQAKIDRLVAAGWRVEPGNFWAPGERLLGYSSPNDAIAEQDRREASAKIPPKPRNPFLEMYGWRPRWNAEQGGWWWDHEKNGRGLPEAAAEKRQQEFNRIQLRNYRFAYSETDLPQSDAAQKPAPRPTCATCPHYSRNETCSGGYCVIEKPSGYTVTHDSSHCGQHPDMPEWIEKEWPRVKK